MYEKAEEEYKGIWRARRQRCCDSNSRPPDGKTRISPDSQKWMWTDLFPSIDITQFKSAGGQLSTAGDERYF